MANDVLATYKALLDQKQKLETDCTSSNAILKQKQTEIEQMAAKIKEKYGVNSYDELVELAQDLNKQLEDQIAQVKKDAPELLANR